MILTQRSGFREKAAIWKTPVWFAALCLDAATSTEKI